MELAKISNEPVLAVPVDAAAVGPVETLKSVPVTAVKPTGEDISVAEVVETPPTQAAVAQPTPVAAQPQPAAVVAQPQPVAVMAKAEPQTLPNTASLLPLFASIGLLSLFAGFTLLIITKRTA
jgi:hypothetical protein